MRVLKSPIKRAIKSYYYNECKIILLSLRISSCWYVDILICWYYLEIVHVAVIRGTVHELNIVADAFLFKKSSSALFVHEQQAPEKWFFFKSPFNCLWWLQEKYISECLHHIYKSTSSYDIRIPIFQNNSLCLLKLRST